MWNTSLSLSLSLIYIYRVVRFIKFSLFYQVFIGWLILKGGWVEAPEWWGGLFFTISSSYNIKNFGEM